ncbi:MAG: Flagellar basal-body rod protein FlgG [Syntrophorhabdus sp. PtaU1.Bin153]|nr:MAG: Flagellar basal-body rod protein FlgG [Syntrophorhabdus sp. PtaU1.Bin153]
MIDNIFRSASTMMLELRRQESLSRNLAACNVPGYKREYVISDTFKNKLQGELNGKQMPQDYLTGPDSGESRIDFSQGALRNTGRKLDFALEGEGFFQVTSPDGKVAYTRNGAFHVSKDSKLVTNEGFVVNGQGGDITFSSTDKLSNVEITTDGLVRVKQDDTGKMKDLAKLKIVTFDNKDKLQRLTASYYGETKEAKMGDAVPGKYQVLNGYLEEANMTPITEMASMIQSTRDFENGQKMLKMLDDRFQKERNTFTR